MEKELKEFVITNSEKNISYMENDVIIKVIDDKESEIKYEILNKDNEKIGVVKEDNIFEFDKEYKEVLKQKMGIYYDGIGVESDNLEADVLEMLEKQEKSKKIISDEQIEQQVEDKAEQTVKDDKIEEKQLIEEEEIKEQGYNITAYSQIRDIEIIKTMISGTEFYPKSIIVAEVDGKFMFLGKEISTGKIKPLKERQGGNSRSENVNKVNETINEDVARGTTMIMPDYDDTEFDVRKNALGQIEVGVIKDLDKNGVREVIAVQTNVIHPTRSEVEKNVKKIEKDKDKSEKDEEWERGELRLH